MKTNLLVAIFLPLFLNAQSQVNYFNYWDSTTEIKTYYAPPAWFGSGSWAYQTQYFDGDTLINGHYYYKQFVLSNNFSMAGQAIVNTQSLTGPDYVRETSELLFVKYDTNAKQDYTLFDNNIVINAKMGDIPSPYFQCPITYIDSIKLNGRYLKRISTTDLKNMDTTLPYQSNLYKYNFFVEGIGQVSHRACELTTDITVLFINSANKQNDSTVLNYYSLCKYFLEPKRKVTGPLSVKLLIFNSKISSGSVILNWQTTNEINFSHFEVERSIDGIHFNKIGIATAQIGNYSFTDNEPIVSERYYRLKMINNDASFIYSNVIEVKGVVQSNFIALAPNPVKDYANITIQSSRSEEGTIVIKDLMGRIVHKQETQLICGKINLKINCTLFKKGFYQIYLYANSRKEYFNMIKE